MKIHWAVNPNTNLGNAFGYYVHNTTLRKYVEKIAEITPEAEDSLIILPPENYDQRVPGKRNWLFTMVEGVNVIDSWAESIQKADFLITPSTWVKEVFAQHFDPERIFVCNHGVEKKFTFKRRIVPDTKRKRFVYLWVGAPNPRKGVEEIIYMWKHFRQHVNDNVLLYLKTTGLGEKVYRVHNIVLDGRKVSSAELVKMYHDANCFIMPHRGEGFGLTLAEAMRTGLPCIATHYSGVTDFYDDDVGYPIKNFEIKEQPMEDFETKGEGKENVKRVIGVTKAAFPSIDELFENIAIVFSDYKAALRKGKKASIKISRDFTWEKSAKTLVDIMGRAEQWH